MDRLKQLEESNAEKDKQIKNSSKMLIDLKTEIKQSRKTVKETETEFQYIQFNYQEASQKIITLTKERDQQFARYEALSVQMANVSHKVRVDEERTYKKKLAVIEKDRDKYHKKYT